MIDYGHIGEYSIKSVLAGGTAEIVLTSCQIDSLSWSEKLACPIYLPIEAM
jgi:hypothetical protein